MRWTFSPVSPTHWNSAPIGTTHQPVQVLLLGGEPSGDNPYTVQDMGEWFRRAHADPRRMGNTVFFGNSLRQLAMVGGELRSLRYGDLKATAGDARASLGTVRAWVEAHLFEVLRFWLPQPDDHDSPEVTVLQGAIAHRVFVEVLMPHLSAHGVGSRFVGLPHPSSMTPQGRLDPGAVAASARPLKQGFGVWRFRDRAWHFTPFDSPR
jgi:hypothetical protein